MNWSRRLDELEKAILPPPKRPTYISFSETPDPAMLRCDQTGELINVVDAEIGNLPPHLAGLKVYFGLSPDDFPNP